ncbi:MAG: DNA polymerase III subunit gamma/tau [Candidatus Magasanikbacteria bacterium]|nr:DNA polymerase III subunit gamma/tau [Candidatus Magasanikbacteria bacterium]
MSLYRKHRPQSFEQVAGQIHIIQTIKNQLSKNKTAHAYLFSGPRGIGKTTTARLIAKSLNCTERKEKEFEPCNSCSSCTSIVDGRSIDVIEIDAASNTGVDTVRENIIENAQFKPTNSLFKVFIIDEVHMLSTSAFNALLKTLEEPPEYIVFILATTELHKLPDTIVSRCQRFQFKKIDAEAIKTHLLKIAKKEKLTVEDDVLNRIIQKSEGHLRDAISLLDQLTSSGEKKITKEMADMFLPSSNIESILEFTENLFQKNTSICLQKLNEIVETGSNPKQITLNLLDLLRNILILKSNPELGIIEINLDKKSQEKINNLQNQIANIELVNLIDLLLKRKIEIPNSPIPQLPLELFVIEFTCDKNEKIEVIQKKTEPKVETPIAPKPETTPNIIVEEIKIEKPVEVKIEETPPEVVEELSPEPEEKKETQTSELNLETVKQKWPVFVAKVEENHPSLVFILKSTTLLDIDGNTINISVPFSFHKDKLTDKVNGPKLLAILTEVLDSKIYLDVVVNDSPQEKPKEKKEMEDLANLMGGEVV